MSTAKRLESQPLDIVEAPGKLKPMIDLYVHTHREMKRLEREMQKLKDEIVSFAKDERAYRVTAGEPDRSFRIEGYKEAVTFVVTDSGGAIEPEDLAAIESEFGSQVRQLLELDLNSLRFNIDVLRPNFEQVAMAFETLPQPILGGLFRPVTFVVSKGATAKIPKLTNEIERTKAILDRIRTKVKLQVG